MDRSTQFLLAVQTAHLAECSAPDKRTVSGTRRALEAIELLKNAYDTARWLPRSVCPFDAAKSFLEWHWSPQFRDRAPAWMKDCAHVVSTDRLLEIIQASGGEWLRTRDVIQRYLNTPEFDARTDCAYFLSTDAADHVEATIARRVADHLRQLVERGDLEGEGNWGDPPAHPCHTRVRAPCA